jgi:hypothetical protein
MRITRASECDMNASAQVGMRGACVCVCMCECVDDFSLCVSPVSESD